MSIRNRFRGTTPVGQWLLGSGRVVKSVQRGEITINAAVSNTDTITAVVPENAVCFYLGHTTNDVGVTRPVTTARVTLTDATTVTATNGLNSGIQIVSYEVVEYMPGVLKSVQRDTISLGGATSATDTITAVDPLKSFVVFGGFTISSFTANNDAYPRIVLTNATTVTATVAATGGSPVVQYTVVEWF